MEDRTVCIMRDNAESLGGYPEQVGAHRANKVRVAQLFAAVIIASALTAKAQPLLTVASFNSTNGPGQGLTLGPDGNFYGTTGGNGGNDNGTVFRVTINGNLTTLVSFGVTNGAYPGAAPILGRDGNLYGTTLGGGSSGYGTVFRVTTNGSLTTLVSFGGTNGADPKAALALGPDGNFYGTTSEGGSNDEGTVFCVTTNGSMTPLASFNGTNGAYPFTALTLGPDGNFYGTTGSGGSGGYGTVFRVTTDGSLTPLAFFNGTNGGYPEAALTLGPDGNFYGTTFPPSDLFGSGTLYCMTTNGSLTTLALFNSTNEAYPGPLTLGPDGNFYGTANGFNNSYGGPAYYGTLFCVNTNGSLTTLVSFGGTNGSDPNSALALGPDGNFYGTTAGGGYGTVFRFVATPIITLQPQSLDTNAGATASFSVSATGLSPPFYQWQTNGTNLLSGGNIAGATTDTLTISGVSDSDAGNYSVVVSNPFGIVMSSNATLTVDDTLIFAAEPKSRTNGVGSAASFSATVYGTPPFVFQWYFNNSPIGPPSSGTNRTTVYTIPNVKAGQAGIYSVEAINEDGSLISSNALLTVLLRPTLEMQIVAGYPLLSLNGMLSNNFVVQYKTSLTTSNWVTLLSVSNLLDDPYLFIDPAGVIPPARFYRAALIPP